MILSNVEIVKALGEKHYFTGEPCKHGHFAPRAVRNRSCLECNRLRAARADEDFKSRLVWAGGPVPEPSHDEFWHETCPPEKKPMTNKTPDDEFLRMVKYFYETKGDPTRYVDWNEDRFEELRPAAYEAWHRFLRAKMALRAHMADLEDEEEA